MSAARPLRRLSSARPASSDRHLDSLGTCIETPDGPAQGQTESPEACISGFALRALADAMQQRGIAASAYMGAATSMLYTQPAESMLPVSRFRQFLNEAAKVAQDPALGLYCGLRASESSFSLYAPLVMLAQTLRQALTMVSHSFVLLSSSGHFEVVERGRTAQLRCSLGSGAIMHEHGVMELMLSGLVRLLRAYGCRNTDISSVNVQYAPPPHHAAYRAALGTEVRFDWSFTGLEVSAHVLDRPHAQHDPAFHGLVQAEARRSLLLRTGGTTWTERVNSLLGEAFLGTLPEMDVIARELGVSERSLRRRLEEEHTSYRALTQALIYRRACTMLEERKLSLTQIAHALGFSDTGAFRRAFRRWSELDLADASADE